MTRALPAALVGAEIELAEGELLVVCGETASGKTALAVALARALDGEIVGADSVQVYRGFDVGSATHTGGVRANNENVHARQRSGAVPRSLAAGLRSALARLGACRRRRLGCAKQRVWHIQMH